MEFRTGKLSLSYSSHQLSHPKYAASKIPTPNIVPKLFFSRGYCYHARCVDAFLGDGIACYAAWSKNIWSARGLSLYGK